MEGRDDGRSADSEKAGDDAPGFRRGGLAGEGLTITPTAGVAEGDGEQ